MAHHKTENNQLELGAEMDYAEHEKTFALFVTLTKYVTLMSVALLIAMAFSFFVSNWMMGTILWVALMIGAYLIF